MRNTAVFCVPVVLALNACTSVPDLPEQYSVSVYDVVNNIRCELQQASMQNGLLTKGKGWSAAIDLELNVAANAGFDANASLETLAVPQKVVVTVGGGHSAKAEQTATFSFAQNLADPGKISCEQDGASEGRHLLRGSLGIINWTSVLNTTVEQSNAGKMQGENGLSPIKAGYVVEFNITWKGSLAPSIEAIPIGKATAKAGLTLSGDRSEKHKMTIAFTPNADAQPQEVIVVGYKKKGATTSNKREIERNLDILTNRSSGVQAE